MVFINHHYSNLSFSLSLSDSSVSIDDAVKLLTSTECIRIRSGKVELVRRDEGRGGGEGRVKCKLILKICSYFY